MESTWPAPRPQGPASDRLCSPWTLAHPAAGRLGGCISAPSAFWGPNPLSLVHEYLPGSENFPLVLSFHELPLHSCPLLPCSTRGTRRKPTGHPHTPRLQPAQGPHSELSLGWPVALCPCVLPTISGSIPPTSHPKGPSLWLQPLTSRSFQLDPRLRPPSSLLWLPHPPALWNEFTKVPLCLPGTLPFCKSWARMGVWRRAGQVVVTALRGQFQENESQFPLGPTHRAEMSLSPSSIKDCGGSQTGS